MKTGEKPQSVRRSIFLKCTVFLSILASCLTNVIDNSKCKHEYPATETNLMSDTDFLYKKKKNSLQDLHFGQCLDTDLSVVYFRINYILFVQILVTVNSGAKYHLISNNGFTLP